MNNVRETSREAYHSVTGLGQKQQQVLDVIKSVGEVCNLDIAYALQLPINRITPRTNELVALGKVVEADRRISWRTGRRVIFWRAA